MEVDLSTLDRNLSEISEAQHVVVDNTRQAEDDVAIAEAISEIEREMETEEREKRWSSIQEVDIDGVDATLQALQEEARKYEADNRNQEDDIAIAEAIAEVEDELRTSSSGKHGTNKNSSGEGANNNSSSSSSTSGSSSSGSNSRSSKSGLGGADLTGRAVFFLTILAAIILSRFFSSWLSK